MQKSARKKKVIMGIVLAVVVLILLLGIIPDPTSASAPSDAFPDYPNLLICAIFLCMILCFPVLALQLS